MATRETYQLQINGEQHSVRATPDTPLLWVLRDMVGLTGTKFGCGIAQCGACTVHVDNEVRRSCVTPVGSIGSKPITTIEGVSQTEVGRFVQDQWLKTDVVQCGYCQSGQILAALALVKSKADITDADIDTHLSGNVCRCGTYPRIRAAIHSISQGLKGKTA